MRKTLTILLLTLSTFSYSREKLIEFKSIDKFNISNWNKTKSELDEFENETERQRNSFNRNNRKNNTLLKASYSLGVHGTEIGVSYSSYINNNKSKWIIPWVVSVSILEIDQNYFNQSGYEKAKLSYWMPGISAYRKIKGDFYANLTMTLPIGTETLTYYGAETMNFVFGVNPSQGICYIPESKFGITFGISIYEKLLTSEVYKNDLGIRAEIGIKF